MLKPAELELKDKTLRVVPGESVRTVVNVRNDSVIVDVFTMEVDGLDRSWYEFSTVSAALFPEDDLASSLIIAPPRDSDVAPQAYPFQVRAKSRQNPAQVLSNRATLTVEPFYGFESHLEKEHLEDPAGRYTVCIENNSNVPLTFVLNGEEPGNDLRFRFDSENITLEAGAKSEVGLIVRSVKRPFSGGPQSHDFTLTVSSNEDAAEPVSLSDLLEVGPLLPVAKWVPPVVLIAVAGIAAGIALAVWQWA